MPKCHTDPDTIGYGYSYLNTHCYRDLDTYFDDNAHTSSYTDSAASPQSAATCVVFACENRTYC